MASTISPNDGIILITPNNFKMKFSPEKIAEAQRKLDQYYNGKRKLSNEDIGDLTFVTTGQQVTKSPKEPDNSNCSFFHLKNIPCTLSVDGGVYLNGIFAHEDHARHYEFTHNGTIYAFDGGDKLDGTLHYENYEPVKLYACVKQLQTKEIYLAIHSPENISLTDSGL